MAKVVLAGFMLAMAGLTYAASPVASAFLMTLAARTGDPTQIADRVDWPAVRESLKTSLSDLEAAKADPGLPRPSLWTRIKAAATPTGLIDGMIDRYVTADGVAAIASRRVRLSQITGAAPPPVVEPPVEGLADRLQRAQAFWARLHRVRFIDLSTFEIEVADRNTPQRRYISLLKQRGFSWQLTSVRIVGVGF